MLKYFDWKKYTSFLFLAVITVWVTHFSTATVSTSWYVLLLVLYYFSDDEAFWLAFFLTTVDGFMGFLGLYSATLEAIPGLPGVEVAQIYIMLSLAKVVMKKKTASPFYGKQLRLLLGYTAFLILLGLAYGLSGPMNNYLKVVKMLLPLVLFYTIPRLMKNFQDFTRLFSLLFLVFLLGYATQLFSLVTGFNPAIYTRRADEAADLEVGRNFRLLYNEAITLVCLTGSLYFLSLRTKKPFPDFFLYLITCLTFAMAFLSATRGWILSFGFMILLHFLLIQKFTAKLAMVLSIFLVIILVVVFSDNVVGRQIQFSIERLTTLEALAGGDLSAGGTLVRLDERGPLVMSVWAESPVFGKGFSDAFFEAQDFHVGNQNILMHAGVIGLGLMVLCLITIILTLLNQYKHRERSNPYRKAFLSLAIILPGWFMLHSSSQQLFAYYGLPLNIMPQAILLGLAGYTVTAGRSYREVLAEEEDEMAEVEVS
jgi:hypothetical protein